MWENTNQKPEFKAHYTLEGVKMKIAVFDIDDTITYETEFLKKYAPVFLEKHGFSSQCVNLSG